MTDLQTPTFADVLQAVINLEAEVTRLTQELKDWTTWGIIEIAIRNPNVSSYMDHWEGRTLKAEADLLLCQQAIEPLVAKMHRDADDLAALSDIKNHNAQVAAREIREWADTLARLLVTQEEKHDEKNKDVAR